MARWDGQDMEGQDRRSRSLPARAVCGTSPRPFVSSRSPQLLGLALAAAILLSGCFGDAPPDPEVQPLEIIVGNADPEYGPCLLNVDEVGAGSHDVTPMSMAGSATVRIIDPSGAVLYEHGIDEHRLQGGGHEVPEEDQGSVLLESGNHRVECTLSSGTTHTTELLVVPARPGYDESDAR